MSINSRKYNKTKIIHVFRIEYNRLQFYKLFNLLSQLNTKFEPSSSKIVFDDSQDDDEEQSFLLLSSSDKVCRKLLQN